MIVVAQDTAIVRMYNVGFGDCFLVLVPASDGVRRVLIDCGSHLAAPGPRPIREVAEQIVADVADEGGQPRIDVVVATHRHYDHVAGFDSAVWQRVLVREVWMPWVEDPRDPRARRIHDAQTRAALGLQQLVASLRAGDAEREIVANALSNEGAMATLHRGFSGRPLRRFLPAEGEPSFETTALPDVGIHLLGPSRDEAVLRDMDPPPAESYLRLAGGEAAAEVLRPFPVSLPAEELERDPQIQRLRKELEVDAFDLAVALEAAVNGTSLVLAFEIGRAVLLFTGDAQWGTWRAALAEPLWRPLLARTTFLKIGHHGSHNATPRQLVESLLPDDFIAMVSVTGVARWPRIPKKELLARLRMKTPKLVRSDRLEDTPPGFVRAPDNSYVEASVPL